MSVWWWIPIGLVAWLGLAVIVGVWTGKFIHRGQRPPPWE